MFIALCMRWNFKKIFNKYLKIIKNKKILKKFFFTFFYKKFWIFPFPLIFCILVALIVLRGGFFHPEADYFLHNAFNDKPFIAKIFSAENHRDGAYQAREFSYVIDFIDAHILVFSAKIGIVHFYSLLHYASLLLTTSLAILISSRYFGQKSYSISILISLLFLTTPAVFLGGNFYRSSKYLISFFMTLMLFYLFRYFSEKKISIKIALLISLLGFLMAISDRQGPLLLSVFILTTALIFIILLVKRSFRSIIILTLLTAVWRLYVYYYDFFAPQLIQYFTGKYPVFAPTSETSAYIFVIPAYKDMAISYFYYQFSYFFGNAGVVIGGIISIIFYIIFMLIAFKPIAKDKSLFRLLEVRSAALYVPLLLIATIPIVAMMLHYSTAFFTWPDIRPVYYNLPVLTLILLFTHIIAARLVLLFPTIKKKLILILCAILLLNIIALPSHYKTLRSGHLKIYYDTSKYVQLCIMSRYIPEKLFTPFMTQHSDEACILFRSILGEETRYSLHNSDCEYFGIKKLLIKNDLILQAKKSSIAIASIETLPDDKFYIIQQLKDKAIERMLCSTEEKIAYNLIQSDKQMGAAALLVEKGDIPLAKRTLLKAENNYTILSGEFIKTTTVGNFISQEMNEAIKIAALRHQKLLKHIINNGKISQEDKKTFLLVLEFSERNYKQIFIAEKEKKERELKLKTKRLN